MSKTTLDEIIGLLNARMPQPKTINEAEARVAMCHEAEQALISLIKELVAEAKPTHGAMGGEIQRIRNGGRNTAIDEFEQNLLKALEEKQ